jgi:creatinine amidohydrolase
MLSVTALGSLNSPQAALAAARGGTLAIPLGATEQHGPHLSLGTDTDIAIAMCERLASMRNVVVAPAVPYGSSGEHAGFAGTLSIGQAALELLLIELVRSATDTFERVLFVNGHGGNAEPLRRAIATLRFEGRDVHCWAPCWEGEPHAGRPETSMQLALHPQRVAMAAARAGDGRPMEEILPLMREGGVRAVSESGVLGDPRGATSTEGEHLLAALSADLVRCFDRWTSR